MTTDYHQRIGNRLAQQSARVRSDAAAIGAEADAEIARLQAQVAELQAALRECRAINDEDQGTFRKRGGTRRGLTIVTVDAALAAAGR